MRLRFEANVFRENLGGIDIVAKNWNTDGYTAKREHYPNFSEGQGASSVLHYAEAQKGLHRPDTHDPKKHQHHGKFGHR